MYYWPLLSSYEYIISIFGKMLARHIKKMTEVGQVEGFEKIKSSTKDEFVILLYHYFHYI